MIIYYSRSNDVNDSEMGCHLETLCNNLPFQKGKHVTLTQHDRDRKDYNPELLNQADLVVVGLSDLDDGSCNIGKGCYDEIERAHDNNIPVIVFLKDDDTDKVFIQKLEVGDYDCDDGDDWICYGSVNLYDELISVMDHVGVGSNLDCDTGVQQVMHDIFGIEKYRELFESDDVEVYDMTTPLKNGDTVIVISSTKFDFGEHKKAADDNLYGTVSNPCAEDDGSVCVHVENIPDHGFGVCFYERADLALIESVVVEELPGTEDLVEEPKIDPYTFGKKVHDDILGDSESDDELLLLG